MSTYWDQYQREQEARAARARRAANAADTALIHSIVWAIISLFSLAIGHLLALAIRHGYGKHLLFLIFVAPIILFVGAFVVALVMGIHAHPQAFLAFWQTYVARHPFAAHWTLLVRDLVRWIHAY
ncbi:MAG: hypothetical protein OWQ56_01590 [Acidithiobacillus caldus]|nr:hypothetical protein [Acidithiobacillus caldus]